MQKELKNVVSKMAASVLWSQCENITTMSTYFILNSNGNHGDNFVITGCTYHFSILVIVILCADQKNAK